MFADIVVKKGLNLSLVGQSARKILNPKLSKNFSIYPADFHGVFPKLVVKENDIVKAGDVLFYDKNSEKVKFCSPVSGRVEEIVRGDRRVVLEIKIVSDEKETYKKLSSVKSKKPHDIIDFLASSGLMPFVKQRPYDVIANPDILPNHIYISGFDSSPLAADFEYCLKDQLENIQTAIDHISLLTNGKTFLTLKKGNSNVLKDIKGVSKINVSGPHPSGNLSTVINKITPINKGDIIWTLNLPDLAIIGNAISTNKFVADRIIALTGSSFNETCYVKSRIGCSIEKLLDLNETNSRIISGNVLTGTNVGMKGHLRFYSNEITAIPEGNDYDLFGWAKPMFNKFSVSRALTFSWLFPSKKYDLNTNTNGEHRAFVVTGSFEEVFPLDIFPMQILKACMYKDLDEMEALGMYEVSPDDFALTEFICVSKQPHQSIIRQGLDLMKKEIG